MLQLVSTPTQLPVTVNDALWHLRIDGTEDNDYLTTLITTATELIEHETNADLRPHTWDLLLPCFPDKEITIPRFPLQSISSIKYYDGNNALQTLSSSNYYVMRSHRALSTIYPKDYWPVSYPLRPDAVIVRFVSGYDIPTGSSSSSSGGALNLQIPAMIKQAVLLAVGTWYEHREDENEANLKQLGLGYQRLINRIKIDGVS